MKTLRIAMLVAGIGVFICLSVLGLIGMFCNYQSAAGLPWALLTFATFIGAFMCSVELGEIKNAKTK